MMTGWFVDSHLYDGPKSGAQIPINLSIYAQIKIQRRAEFEYSWDLYPASTKIHQIGGVNATDNDTTRQRKHKQLLFLGKWIPVPFRWNI